MFFKKKKQSIRKIDSELSAFGSAKKKIKSIDSIHAKKKTKTTVQPTIIKKVVRKRKNLNSWFWLIILVLTLLSLSLFGLKAASNKLSMLKMFKGGKYLVLFQNNAEARPTGGFIGSFAIITFQNYRVKNIDFNANISKLDKAYTADHIVPPPAPLEMISGGRWAMRDSNFAVSFPEAAQKVAWFYNQETGESVDGVIALNASVLQDFLSRTGPINLTDQNITITKDNFFTELTTQIESDYYSVQANQQANEPKSIIKDMMPEVFKRVTSQNKFGLVNFVLKEINQKQILFYANDNMVEQAILKSNWGGAVKNSQSDYLQVNIANLGGAKSSLNVKDSFLYTTENQNGTLSSSLTISRTHTGTGVWPDGTNISWIRVLVPNGSTLQKVLIDNVDVTSQVEIGTEADKTYFGFWQTIKPQTSSVVTLQYTLPNTVSADKYQLLLQKQPGNPGDLVKVMGMGKLLFNDVLNTDVTLK